MWSGGKNLTFHRSNKRLDMVVELGSTGLWFIWTVDWVYRTVSFPQPWHLVFLLVLLYENSAGGRAVINIQLKGWINVTMKATVLPLPSLPIHHSHHLTVLISMEVADSLSPLVGQAEGTFADLFENAKHSPITHSPPWLGLHNLRYISFTIVRPDSSCHRFCLMHFLCSSDFRFNTFINHSFSSTTKWLYK